LLKNPKELRETAVIKQSALRPAMRRIADRQFSPMADAEQRQA
jgi:hypothetical protein